MPLPFTAILCLGAGLAKPTASGAPRTWIGQETLLRAAAGAKLWKESSGAILLMSGGPPSGSPFSEATVMKDYVCNTPWNVPAANVLTEDTSIETASNVRNSVAILRKLSLSTDNIALVAGKNNLHRATAYFRAFGIRVAPCLARNVLGKDMETLGLPTLSDAPSLHDRSREIILLILQLFDRKGHLATWYKHRLLEKQCHQS